MSEVWFDAAKLVDHEQVRVDVDVEDLVAGQRWSAGDKHDVAHRNVGGQNRRCEQKAGAARGKT